MKLGFATFVLAALFLVALPASAQDATDRDACADAWESREYSPVKGIEPTVSVMRSGSLTHDCDVIAIYFRYGNWDGETTRPPRVYHFARLTRATLFGITSTRWADSRQCTALSNAIARLAAIKPPTISIPGHIPQADRPLTIQLDGDSFLLSNRLGPEFRGNQASELGVWTYAALKDLEPCWTNAAPSVG